MKTSKSSLFLMELIIVILFFSLASAVCVQLFVKAHMLDEETISATKTTIILEDLTESFQGAYGDPECLFDIYEGYNRGAEANQLMVYYDEDLVAIPLTASTSAVYAGVLTVEGDLTPGSFQLGHITIYSIDGLIPLSSLDLKIYIPLVSGQ